jgi:CHAD domain-containing protein
MVRSALAHWLPNAAELTGGSGQTEHLHQLRVALRRLRSALRLFAGWSAEPEAALALEARLREPFARLGAARDQDALAATLWPALAAAGGPTLSLPPAASDDTSAIVREPLCTLAALEAMRLALPSPATAPTPPTAAGDQVPLKSAARRLLQRDFKRAMRDAAHFETVDIELQHRVRKRLKRLRYGAEFVQSLLQGRRSERTLALLRKALEALGDYNDLRVAEQRITELVKADPRAWFALGWLAARREVLMRRAGRGLRRLAGAPSFGS